MTVARVTDTGVGEHGPLYSTPWEGVNGNVSEARTKSLR
jgi:hypothetical protein